MDDDKITKEEQDLQDRLFLIPEEVQEFIWSESFDLIIDTAEKTIPLTKEEKVVMKNIAYDLVIGITTVDKAAEKLIGDGIEKEKVIKILYIIETQILELVKNLVKSEEENEDQDDEVATNTESVSPSEALRNIQERLTKPSGIAPVTRDYSIERQTTKDIKPDNISHPPVMDIYREIPEK